MSTEEKTNQQSIEEITTEANPAKNIIVVKAPMKQEYTLDNMKHTEVPEPIKQPKEPQQPERPE